MKPPLSPRWTATTMSARPKSSKAEIDSGTLTGVLRTRSLPGRSSTTCGGSSGIAVAFASFIGMFGIAQFVTQLDAVKRVALERE